MQLVGLALIGLGLTILSLGLAARQLSPEGNAIIRIAPGWGFWLLVLVFAMMLVDALARSGWRCDGDWRRWFWAQAGCCRC